MKLWTRIDHWTFAMDVAGGAIVRFTDWGDGNNEVAVCSMVFVPGASVADLLEQGKEGEDAKRTE